MIILLTGGQLNNQFPFLQKSFQCYQKCSVIEVLVQFVYTLYELHEGNRISEVINL